MLGDELYFGTWDTTTSTQVVAGGGNRAAIGGEAGADLFKFSRNASAPAVAVTRDGFGNPGNFGVRNLVVGARLLLFCFPGEKVRAVVG